MKKVLILESHHLERPAGFDHVFSFGENTADSFPEHYLSCAEADQIYTAVYHSLMTYLERLKSTHPFYFLEVDLLWCFKKYLFEYFYGIVLRLEILKRLEHQFPTAHFYVEAMAHDPVYPYLNEILKEEIGQALAEGKVTVLEKKDAESEGRKARTVYRWISDLLPFRRLCFGTPEKSSTLIFSDLKKASDVLNELSSASRALLTPQFSPRLFLKAAGRFSLIQILFGPRKANKEKEECRHFQKLADSFPFYFLIGSFDFSYLLRKKIKNLFSTHLLELVFQITEADHFLKHSNTKNVLLDEDIAPFKNAFCQLAANHAVKTFVECHGALGHPSGFLPLTASQIFVWGNAQKEKLIWWGAPADRITVTGTSRYESYQSISAEAAKKKVLSELKLDPDKKLILFGVPLNRGRRHFFGHHWQSIIWDTLKTLEAEHSNDCQLIIKIHQGDETLDFYQKWLKQKKGQLTAKIITHYDPLLLAKACDVLLAYYTTYAIDGIAFDKPVILLRDKDSDMLSEFRAYPAFFYAEDGEEAALHLKSIISGNRHVLTEAKRECLNLDGQNAARTIAGLIQESD